MPVSVVDASALTALAFGESEAPAIAEMLENQTLVAPALVVYEVGNACWKKCRRDPASAVELSKAFADILKLEIKLFAIEPADVLVVAPKARRHVLRRRLPLVERSPEGAAGYAGQPPAEIYRSFGRPLRYNPRPFSHPQPP